LEDQEGKRGMLFAIDAGNTNITIGLFDGERLEKTFRMTTIG